MFNFKKTNYIPVDGKQRKMHNSPSEHMPADLWMKCDACGEMLLKEDVVSNHYVCYKCGKYFRLRSKTRIKLIADKGSFVSWDDDLETTDPLSFPEYKDKIKKMQEKTKLKDGVLTGECTIDGEKAVVCVCDGRFMMGSMGYVVGEKITRAVEQATKKKLPVVIFTCSGGARMQEGMISLMQMAKTSAALKKHSDAGLFYLTVLTDPTTGGVTASFAMLGDVILAEPGSLVGFAGPRVIEQTIGQKLPDGFQRAEFLVEHGLIDGIIHREDQADTIARLIRLHRNCDLQKLDLPEIFQDEAAFNMPKINRSVWERVEIARSKERLTALDYIDEVFEEFYELHGDRRAADDGAIIGGIAMLAGKPVTVIGQQKGRTTKENIFRNFGMPQPEGYVKALRLMKQAEKFKRPIICFVDTPGAFCGMEAEEHGQGQAIANNLFEMAGIKVPILSLVIGEGGSGGALALAVGNEVWMMENATYSVLSPEGFASILWKDASKASHAAQVMKMTASDLLELGIIEKVIEEQNPATTDNIHVIGNLLKKEFYNFMEKYCSLDASLIVDDRQKRFRAF
ncbi:acetyl-CoA carboxylase, carboxyltransferase subunit beta [Eubacterium oxidoreducens]|uniref:Multifunctional fusion protein n=1 Tax=Eubacterium oxidoreducens TaxID=1732 RepID=A0A1G6BF31_EUBOX|nr:acetyl-CoA carboxylase, carboxyltransferase subunit beta [Eubacterium oxidoreducens]SDB19225.1 acetyl-CoA carboxylase carboxyl transferase subunit beta [Eubacterium oxidoreducens]